MIIDTLSNFVNYVGTHPHFEKVWQYLCQTDLQALPNGRYEILGDTIFMNVVTAGLRKAEEAALEVHDDYTDIQIVLHGTESFGWMPRTMAVMPRGEMDVDKDILFYGDAPHTYFTLRAQEMTIFFPEDAHAPLVGDGEVKKCIVKVRTSQK